VVGVINRSTPDSIALVEIKDDGVTGRLQADLNIMKIRVQHQEYKNVFWTYRTEHHLWARARYDEGLNRILPQGAFEIGEMVYLT
jgi:hypothetical protein